MSEYVSTLKKSKYLRLTNFVKIKTKLLTSLNEVLELTNSCQVKFQIKKGIPKIGANSLGYKERIS